MPFPLPPDQTGHSGCSSDRDAASKGNRDEDARLLKEVKENLSALNFSCCVIVGFSASVFSFSVETGSLVGAGEG